ncbi:MAG: hypothetical protein HY582_03735 [Candidatus Omnitrophica bacterium]|nr:hypothetical protein [Candidatus Omnitrophota bacterium]
MEKASTKCIPQFFLAGFLALILFLTGCIRLWGGATYVKDKPGDYVEKTYILDTGQIGEDKQVKGSVR